LHRIKRRRFGATPPEFPSQTAIRAARARRLAALTMILVATPLALLIGLQRLPLGPVGLRA
jgi:hypothetical protein